MNTSITILGRKTDLLLLGGIVILTIFITINTLCNCQSCGSEINTNGSSCCKNKPKRKL